MTEQDQEIGTIRKRTIEVNLSTADCDRIARKAGEASLSVGELVASFIGDLVAGTYSNGSDERARAQQWFERCHFGAFPESTFLKYLIDECEIDFFLKNLEMLEDTAADLAEYESEPTEPDALEDFKAIQKAHDFYLQELQEFYSEYKEYCGLLPEWEKQDPETWESGLARVKAWKAELDRIKGE